MKLTDIATRNQWIELEQKINARSGLNAAVYDVDGLRITDFKKWANRLCPVIKADQKGQSYICALAHQNIAAQAKQTRRTVIGECDAGLMKIAVPIFLDDEFLGVAGGCGYIMGDGGVDLFMVNKTTGIASEKLIDLAADVPTMTPQQAESLARFIQDEIDRIIKAYESCV